LKLGILLITLGFLIGAGGMYAWINQHSDVVSYTEALEDSEPGDIVYIYISRAVIEKSPDGVSYIDAYGPSQASFSDDHSKAYLHFDNEIYFEDDLGDHIGTRDVIVKGRVTDDGIEGLEVREPGPSAYTTNRLLEFNSIFIIILASFPVSVIGIRVLVKEIAYRKGIIKNADAAYEKKFYQKRRIRIIRTLFRISILIIVLIGFVAPFALTMRNSYHYQEATSVRQAVEDHPEGGTLYVSGRLLAHTYDNGNLYLVLENSNLDDTVSSYIPIKVDKDLRSRLPTPGMIDSYVVAEVTFYRVTDPVNGDHYRFETDSFLPVQNDLWSMFFIEWLSACLVLVFWPPAYRSVMVRMMYEQWYKEWLASTH